MWGTRTRAHGCRIGSRQLTLIGYNVLLQGGLLPTPEFRAFDRRYLSVYLTIAMVACGLFFVGSLTPLNFFAWLAFAACACLCVFAATRRKLSIAETFPKLPRPPLTRLIFA